MSKKVLSLLLALVMVLGSFSMVSAASYDDVTGTVYEEAVARLSLLEVLEGYPDGSFKPENTITRAEFAAVAIRAKGLNDAAVASKGLPTGFTDVPTWNWASGYVGTAGKLGVVNGIGNGKFAPEAPVKYEEAVTMIVRLLGYESAAQAKGGYPYGYLIVANEVGLLDGVKGTQGQPAPRGLVAQITDNALEIPMMIQVGFGADVKFVVSGSNEHGTNASEQYLLDSMGFDSVTGRVISVNDKTNKVTVDPTNEDLKNVTLKVKEGFDFYAVEGLETKFWYDSDDVVIVSAVQEEAKFDAVKVDKKELELITEDESYEVAKNATLTVDGDKVKQDEFVADYAKVVLNDDDEIVWAQGYKFDGFILVEEVKGNTALSFDDYDEVNLKDFTVVAEGKTIGIDGIEEEDILFYNDSEEFAVVYNNSKEGKIERVYANDKENLRFAGKNYVIASDAIYLNEEGKIGEITTDVLEDIMDEEEEITIFFNFKNEVSVVLAGPEVGTSAYYVMTKNANEYKGRNGSMLALDVRNSEGTKLTFDLDKDFLGKDNDYKEQKDYGGFEVKNTTPDAIKGSLLEGQVLKISVDKDGEPTEVVRMNALGSKDDIEVDDSRVKATNDVDYKLRANTVVFYDDTDEAILLSDAKDEFSEIEKEDAKVYVEKGYVVAIVGKTNADSDYTTVSGVLKNKSHISRLAGGYYEFRLEVAGDTARYVTEDKYNVGDISFEKDAVINLKIGDKSGKVIEDGFELAKGEVIDVADVRGNTIEDSEGNRYTFNSKSGQAYKADLTKIRLSAVEGKTVAIYFEGNSGTHVNYVIVGGAAQTPAPVDPTPVSFTGVKATGAVISGVDKKAAVDKVLAEKAAVTVGDIKLEANTAGVAGNDISIEIVALPADTTAKTVTVKTTGNAIKVGVLAELDAFGDTIITTKNSDVVTAITGDTDAKALVTATVVEGKADASADVAKANLAGGVDAKELVPEVPAVKEVYTLTINSGATANGTITVKGADKDVDVTVVKDMSASDVAAAIKAYGLKAAGYDITVDGAKVVFTATEGGVKTTSLDITVVDK